MFSVFGQIVCRSISNVVIFFVRQADQSGTFRHRDLKVGRDCIMFFHTHQGHEISQPKHFAAVLRNTEEASFTNNPLVRSSSFAMSTRSITRLLYFCRWLESSGTSNGTDPQGNRSVSLLLLRPSGPPLLWSQTHNLSEVRRPLSTVAFAVVVFLITFLIETGLSTSLEWNLATKPVPDEVAFHFFRRIHRE